MRAANASRREPTVYRLLNDLRILRLALHMEETFERYEENLRHDIPQVPIRAKLAPLFDEGDAHERLRRAFAELSRAAARRQSPADSASILQTLHDCEEAAHEFYLHYLDRLSDPALIQLFKDLAAEEADHAQVVEQAREMLRSFPVGVPFSQLP